jgi:hypothetical protein|tara:strand:- start:1474 stop:2211 length:738 start_codon:yes stop_codon:yes gene_type:complete
MINKNIVQNVISKYYLGEIERVKWEIRDNHLTVNFVAPSRMVLGSVKCGDFPLEDADLAIYNTKKLSNLISICSGDLLLELEKQKEMLLKLNISDLNFNLSYALSDPLLIKKAGKARPVDGWDIELKITREEIGNLLKAKSALADIDNMLVTTTQDLDGVDVCEFVFGDEAGHNNKITYQLKGEIKKDNIKIRYNSDMLKTILNANKDVDEGLLKISQEGLMYLSFQNENIESEYYMVPQEDGVL